MGNIIEDIIYLSNKEMEDLKKIGTKVVSVSVDAVAELNGATKLAEHYIGLKSKERYATK